MPSRGGTATWEPYPQHRSNATRSYSCYARNTSAVPPGGRPRSVTEPLFRMAVGWPASMALAAPERVDRWVRGRAAERRAGRIGPACSGPMRIPRLLRRYLPLVSCDPMFGVTVCQANEEVRRISSRKKKGKGGFVDSSARSDVPGVRPNGLGQSALCFFLRYAPVDFYFPLSWHDPAMLTRIQLVFQ